MKDYIEYFIGYISIEKNANIMHIKELMGHRSIENTEVYLHVTRKDLEESILLF